MAELKFLHVCNAIVPLTPAPALTLPLLTQGTVDEMRPPEPIRVPLWLALFFKKRDKCNKCGVAKPKEAPGVEYSVDPHVQRALEAWVCENCQTCNPGYEVNVDKSGCQI